MTVFEGLLFAVAFASLVVAMLSFNHKNNPPLMPGSVSTDYS